MKNKYIWIGIVVIILIILVFFPFGAIFNLFTSSKNVENSEFILSEDNFDLVSLSYYAQPGLSLDDRCTSQDKKNIFTITYNIKEINSLKEPLKCNVVFDGAKYYGKIYDVGIDREKRSDYFCNDPNYNWEVGETCYYARADITKSTDITLCCNGICKTKTLPAYCLV